MFIITFDFLDTWEGRQVFISGFASKHQSESRLQAASLKIDPFSYCIESHKAEKFLGNDEASRSLLFKLDRSLPNNFQSSLFCARHSTDTHGSCPGDSGGPLITEIGGFYYQLGIIHGALHECSNKVPGIYVRIDHPKILGFIQNELGSVLPNRPFKGMFCTLPLFQRKLKS